MRYREPHPGRAIRKRSKLQHLIDKLLRFHIAVAGDDAGILVFDHVAALVQLPDRHQRRLHDVQRLKARDHDRPHIFAREVFVRLAADYRTHMRRPEKGVDGDAAALLRVSEDGFQRGGGQHVVAEHGEILEALSLRFRIATAVGGVVVSKPMAKKTTSRLGFWRATFSASSTE